MQRTAVGMCFLILLIVSSSAGQVAAQQTLDNLIDREIASLVATYKSLHAAPELSHYEEKTSAFVARELRTLGYTVTDSMGKYKRPE